MTQAHIFYSGVVQGVGFRYTVQRFALDIGLCGWVRNLRDGRVEALVEGKREDIEQLMQGIEKQFGAYIKGKETKYGQAQGRSRDFRIVF